MKTYTPWHIWVVGIIGVLWNAMGAFDYVMTKTKNEAYMSNYTAEELAFFYSFPSWSVAAWAIAVWGGVLGCILILCRKGLAVPVFALSLIGLLVNMIYLYGFRDGFSQMGAGGALFSFTIFIVAIFLLMYARRMKASGILV